MLQIRFGHQMRQRVGGGHEHVVGNGFCAAGDHAETHAGEDVGVVALTRHIGSAVKLDRIERAFPTARASRLDGLRLDWEGGWLLVRASNTEPIVRIVAEAADAIAVDEAIQRATAALLAG